MESNQVFVFFPLELGFCCVFTLWFGHWGIIYHIFICALLMDIWAVFSIWLLQIMLLWLLLPVFGIHMHAFLMGAYKGVIAGLWVHVCSALRATDKAIVFQFWHNYVGSSSLLADECNVTFHRIFSPKRLRQELDQDSHRILPGCALSVLGKCSPL